MHFSGLRTALDDLKTTCLTFCVRPHFQPLVGENLFVNFIFTYATLEADTWLHFSAPIAFAAGEETCEIHHHDLSGTGKEGKLGANAMKRVAAGSHLLTP